MPACAAGRHAYTAPNEREAPRAIEE